MIRIDTKHAEKISSWIDAGGVRVWDSVNLSNPGLRWFTPHDSDKPNWQASHESTLVTDSLEFEVATFREVKRFYVAIRPGAQGFTIKLTDGATRKVNRALANAGDGATHEFDYLTQEAVILVPDSIISLSDWRARNET
jgi:hypothetical protein